MPTPERLRTEATSTRATEPVVVASLALTETQVEAVVATRTELFTYVEKELSPIMREAVGIKLAHEKTALETYLKGESDAAAERANRRDILDSRFFKKKPLPRT